MLTLTGWLIILAAVLAATVIALAAAGAGIAALYVTAFGAVVLLCGLEKLRKASG